MRIVHIDTGREMRGGQHQVMLLLRGLRERGYPQVLLAREQSPLWQAAKDAGHAVHPATWRELRRWSKQADTIIHAHDARAHTLAAVAARTAFVVSRRVAFPVRKSLLSRWKYKRATRFLAVSQFVCESLAAAGVSRERIDIVYDAVETHREKVQWNPLFPIVALASTDPGKGRDLMEKAAALANAEVVYSDNLPRDLRRASMFVYLTRSEGFGSAALLAMSMGVPVIASRVEGLAEVFVHQESGLYVSNDIPEIARSMRLVLHDPHLAKRLAEGGQKRVQERFTAEHMINNTLRVYEKALAG